jgi:transcriptional regulator with XRE-family HTH domain
MFRFNLKGADIAERSGLTTAQISQFRNGQNIRVDNLERILAALPEEARSYLLSLVNTDPLAEPDTPYEDSESVND